MWRELSLLIVSLAPSLPLYTNKEVSEFRVECSNWAQIKYSEKKMIFQCSKCIHKRQENLCHFLKREISKLCIILCWKQTYRMNLERRRVVGGRTKNGQKHVWKINSICTPWLGKCPIDVQKRVFIE